MSPEGSLDALDAWAIACPLLAIVVGVGVHVVLRRRA
jgi:hypothetical protein